MGLIKVVSIINMKGGVGKTTLTCNLAYALAYFHKKKVLLVDIDPQFNATQYFMKQEDYLKYINDKKNYTIFEIFKEPLTEAPSTVNTENQKIELLPPSLTNTTVHIYEGKDGNRLDMIPSTLQLMELESSARGSENRLKIFIDNIKNAYDFIFVDCPPTMSILTLSAYLASDAYLIPIKPDHLSSVGLPLLERAIKKYEVNFPRNIKQLGIIFTMVTNTNLMKDTMRQISSTNRVIFRSKLRHSVKIAEAVQQNQALFMSRDAEEYGEEIKQITNEFLGMVNKNDT